MFVPENDVKLGIYPALFYCFVQKCSKLLILSLKDITKAITEAMERPVSVSRQSPKGTPSVQMMQSAARTAIVMLSSFFITVFLRLFLYYFTELFSCFLYSRILL